MRLAYSLDLKSDMRTITERADAGDPTADLGRIGRQQLFISTTVNETLRKLQSHPFLASDLIDAAPASMRLDPNLDPLKAADLAQQVGLRIYTIGIGADQMEVASVVGGRRRINPSADLDEETLTQIAELTGGRYFRATDTATLQDIYGLVDELEPVEEPESGFRPVKSYYYWPLGFAFALCLGLCLASLLERVILKRRAEVHAHAR